MDKRNKRIYRSRNPIKTIAAIISFVLIVIVLLLASIFIGFRQYIVYDDGGGLHLEVPWLEETMPQEDAETGSSKS